jgi:hypothetical protein
MSSAGQEGSAEVDIFPGLKIFPAFTADGLAHGMSLGRVTDNSEWTGNVGAAVPLVQVGAGGILFQLGAAATTFNRIIKSPGHITVSTIDYRIDFPLDLRLNSLAFRVALGHVSSHFADDGIEILHEQSISYVRDYLTLAVAYDVPFLAGYVYAGGDWNFHFEPITGPWILQVGGEGAHLNLAKWAQFYVAIDLKCRENLSWGTTQSYQAGVRLFLKEHYALRLAYTLRNGFDERGQFFDQQETMHLVALFIDF